MRLEKEKRKEQISENFSYEISKKKKIGVEAEFFLGGGEEKTAEIFRSKKITETCPEAQKSHPC